MGYKSLPGPDGQPFPSYRAFCAAKHPWGLGYPPEVIDILAAGHMSAAERARNPLTLHEHGEIGNGRSKHGVIKSTSGGTGADYLTARIARDRPNILAEMAAGKFPSVRAAALKAGIIKARVRVPLDIDRAAAVLLRYFDGQELIDALNRAAVPASEVAI